MRSRGDHLNDPTTWSLAALEGRSAPMDQGQARNRASGAWSTRSARNAHCGRYSVATWRSAVEEPPAELLEFRLVDWIGRCEQNPWYYPF